MVSDAILLEVQAEDSYVWPLDESDRYYPSYRRRAVYYDERHRAWLAVRSTGGIVTNGLGGVEKFCSAEAAAAVVGARLPGVADGLERGAEASPVMQLVLTDDGVLVTGPYQDRYVEEVAARDPQYLRAALAVGAFDAVDRDVVRSCLLTLEEATE